MDIYRFAAVLCAIGACLISFACKMSDNAHKPPTYGVVVPGTLYLIHEYISGVDGFGSFMEVRRNGKQIQRFDLRAWRHWPTRMIARNRPSIKLASQYFGGDVVDTKHNRLYTLTTTCHPIAISPNGVYAACLRMNGRDDLTIFKVAEPARTQINLKHTVGTLSPPMADFISDSRLAVLVDDDSCPFFKRADGRYSDEPQARLTIIDVNGRTVKSGSCAFGIAANGSNIAVRLLDNNGKSFYSINGRPQRPGIPITFDGSGNLLVIDSDGNLINQRGQFISSDVSQAWWSK